MEMALFGGKTGLAHLWFDVECREGRRLVREALRCFVHKSDDSRRTR